MKTERLNIIIGVSIAALFAWFYSYSHNYADTPSISRKSNNFLEWIEGINLRFNDIKYKIKPARTSNAPVALIAIDDASLREIGRWPWSREQIAELTQKVTEYGASSISYDIIFSEPEKSNPAADLKFAEIVKNQSDKIVLGTFSENLTNFAPHQDLCVAEAFLATGGNNIVKINPGFTIDEESNPLEDLNWAPFFETIFGAIKKREVNRVLAELHKTSVKDLSNYQLNNLSARQSQALFSYCQSWLGQDDIFLKPENIAQAESLYKSVMAEDSKLSKLALSDLAQHIRSSYKPHPIPQYGEWTPNTEILQEPASYTASFIAQLDSDGIVRRYPLFFRSGQKLGTSFIPSMALQSFLLSGTYRAEIKMKSDKNGTKALDSFIIYDTSHDPEKQIVSLPVDKSGQLLISYYGRQMSLPYVSAKELFNSSPKVKVTTNVINKDTNQLVYQTKEYDKKEFFKNRNLIMGATAVGLYDLRNTPVEVNYPGPELHLTVLANLLDQNFLKSWRSESVLMPWLILTIGLLATILWSFLGPIPSVFAFVVIISSLLALDIWIFIEKNTVVNSFFIYASLFNIFGGIQLFKYFTEEKTKRELRSTFSKYVSPAVVDELLKDTENLKLGGRRERMTAFFSDVRGFTTIAEKLPPEELSRVLNLYLTPMTDIVFKNQGTLDKYMGDAVMAFFGAPVKDADHATHACRCALESIKELKSLQSRFSAQGLPHIDIGIGINTGEMSVGNMGSNIVQNYTVMGDSVNLASRLEGINKEYGTRIVISEFTHADIQNKFTTREIDRVRVKGKLEPVRIYELICEGNASGDQAKMLSKFNEGYNLYQNKDFRNALDIFKISLNLDSSEDPVSALYIERCKAYLTDPPPSEWDGVYVMKTK